MKTTHRIVAALLVAATLASCATDTETEDDDSPAENTTTDTNEATDEPED